MNGLLAEPPFPLARRLAAAVTLVALGVLWSPALPISPMLALAGARPTWGQDCSAVMPNPKPHEATYAAQGAGAVWS
jgi:hypothetical protein